jgi:hypothetical protein
MRRIVNGVTYNTETSTALGRSQYDGNYGAVEETLYQTRAGSFFVDEKVTRQVWNKRERDHEVKVAVNFIPMSRERAHKWILNGNVEIFCNPFDDPTEATKASDWGATIYIRLPPSLKKRVYDAARDSELSANAWAVRCVEHCLEGCWPGSRRRRL